MIADYYDEAEFKAILERVKGKGFIIGLRTDDSSFRFVGDSMDHRVSIETPDDLIKLKRLLGKRYEDILDRTYNFGMVLYDTHEDHIYIP